MRMDAPPFLGNLLVPQPFPDKLGVLPHPAALAPLRPVPEKIGASQSLAALKLPIHRGTGVPPPPAALPQWPQFHGNWCSAAPGSPAPVGASSQGNWCANTSGSLFAAEAGLRRDWCSAVPGNLAVTESSSRKNWHPCASSCPVPVESCLRRD